MSTVSIARCETYEPDAVEMALSQVLAPLGGISAFVSPGNRVLLKVNLLSRALPERAVTTHPELVRALIRAVRGAGGQPTVGDSPGGPNTAGLVRRVWQDSGIAEVCAEEDVPMVLFDDDTVRVPNPAGSLYGAFTLGRVVADADVVITVPKFKTHGLMMFTGAVKNLFGCIPGLEKAQYHLKLPDRNDFGSMLVDLMLACRPALAVMDAVVGMEGEGPAGGTPRQIGALIASADCVALDVVASSMAGLDPMEVYSNRAAAKRDLGPSSADEVDVVGADWRELAPEGFALPARDAGRGLPPWLARRLTSWTTARPVLERASDCTLCGTCAKVCPVEAIAIAANGPVFDRSSCIRCYCCQELCPPQAIGLTVPPLARIASRQR
ncbi:MAG TPA: DUF362 domain-containing protein [Coriobacteriia bacterium]|nr:DUF362 domain-containing protein [Coriobacteriia bacterium]